MVFNSKKNTFKAKKIKLDLNGKSNEWKLPSEIKNFDFLLLDRILSKVSYFIYRKMNIIFFTRNRILLNSWRIVPNCWRMMALWLWLNQPRIMKFASSLTHYKISILISLKATMFRESMECILTKRRLNLWSKKLNSTLSISR